MSKKSLGKILKSGKEIDPTELKKKLKSAIFSQPLHHLVSKTTDNKAFSPFQYDWVANSDQTSFSELEDVINVDVVDLTRKKKKKKDKAKTTKAKVFKEKRVKLEHKPIIEPVVPIETILPTEPTSIKKPDLPEVDLTTSNPKKDEKKRKSLKSSKKVEKLEAKRKTKASKKAKKTKKKIFNRDTEDSKLKKQEDKSDSFSSWLKSLKNKEVAVDQEFTLQTAVSEPIKKSKKANKFTNKKKEKAKKKLSPKKKALKQKISTSIMSKEDIATETLAQLYAEQGYNKKAIVIYERLSLKNPEKSSFFADQIQNLKKEIQ